MIPSKIHFVFGFNPQFCNKPLCEFHSWNIQLAKYHNPDCDIYFHYLYEPPSSNSWDIIKHICILNKVSHSELSYNINFKYTEHVADLYRLYTLYNYGGIYLDIDVACVNSLNKLLTHKCVMGIEYGNNDIIGLCNAVLLSEQKSDFIKIWIDEFKNDYREQWEYNCVKMPYELSKKHVDLIHVEPRHSFFKFSWDDEGKIQLFEQTHSYDESYCIHLWEHKNYHILSDLKNYKSQTTLSTIYKKFL